MIAKNGKTLMISVILLLLVITIAAAYVGSQQNERNSANEPSRETNNKQFVCSMHPEIIKDEPGDCPICGMSLIEKIEHDLNSPDSLLMDVVRPVNSSVLGSVATVYPVEETLPLTIETFGIINFDTRRIHTISARFPGLVERSFVKYQFQQISKGQKIYEIYCPNIYADRWNYVKLIQMYPDKDSLTVEARQWFQLLGLSKGQLDSLKRTVKPDYHLTVYSDASGYAVSADFDAENYFSSTGNEKSQSTGIQSGRGGVGFDDGLTIETGTPLFKIINLQSLRADLKVKAEDVGVLKKGQKVVLMDEDAPMRTFDAIVSQVEPLNGGVFQLVKVFFKDTEGRMKPGRQIKGHILAGNRHCLWVPRSSIIHMGQQHSVFVMHNGRFIPTAIKTGLRSGDKVEVLSGIDQDSEIAFNASLLTDSDGFIPSGQQWVDLASEDN